MKRIAPSVSVASVSADRERNRMGARFAKWRAVISVGDGIPSRSCLEVNAHACARYAALCHEAGLVPVVEPEVLMAGEHTLARCLKVTQEALRNVVISVELPARVAGRDDSQTKHGASGINLPRAGNRERGSRRHGEMSPTNRSRCRNSARRR